MKSDDLYGVGKYSINFTDLQYLGEKQMFIHAEKAWLIPSFFLSIR